MEPTVDAPPRAAYLYLLALDGPGLAWEYLRRDPAYRDAWRRGPAAAGPGGCDVAEDPRLDAREAAPAWGPDPADAVRLVRTDTHYDAASPAFDLWAFAGRKQLVCDGARLSLTADAPGGPWRARLAADVAHGAPYGYAVPAGAAPEPAFRAIDAFRARAGGASAVARPADRVRLAHLKAIQALDAEAAGAGHQEIALALFGEAAVAGRWSPDGDLRAQVRDALARGRAFRAGRWRELVWPGTSRSRSGRTT